MLAKRQRLHIDPHYSAPTPDGRDPLSSPASSSSPPFAFSPPSDVSSASSLRLSPMSANGAGPSTWRLSFVLCLYDFDSTDSDHMPFRRNEILEIVKKEESGWWAALRDDRIGWVPSAFMTELTDEAAEKLLAVSEGLRVYEYEAELLYSSQPFTSNSPFFDVSLSPSNVREKGEEESWIPPVETPESRMHVMSTSGLVVKDLPDDVAPLSGVSPSPYSHNQTESLDTRSTEPDTTSTKDTLAQPVTYRLLPAIPSHQSSRPTLSPLDFNKPTPPTPAPPISPSPTPISPRSFFLRSRSDSAPLLDRELRKRPIMTNEYSSLSRISVLLDSPRSVVDARSSNEARQTFDTDLERLRPATRRSDKILKLTGDDDAQAFHNSKLAQENLPWYLKPSYSSDDIKMEYDGSVRAGTLSALVERLTADPLNMAQETVYRDVFFTTFTTFTNARDLFNMLVACYKMQQPPSLNPEQSREWRKKRLRHVHTRVLSILSNWVDKYGLLQDDPHIVPELRDFLEFVVSDSPPSQALTAKLLLQQIDKKMNVNIESGPVAYSPSSSPSAILMPTPSTSASTPTASPSNKRRKNSRGLVLGLGHAPSPKDLLRLDPAELAAQLMLYEYRLYVQVRPRECLVWAKKQEGEAVKHLVAFCATNTKLAAWVTTSVLDHDGIKKRAEMVDFWVKVAEKCRALNNFASMTAIVVALSSSALSRLHLTWAHAARAHHLEPLTPFPDPQNNFAQARGALKALPDGSACVPFIGMFLKDIVHTQDRYRNMVQFPLSAHSLSNSYPHPFKHGHRSASLTALGSFASTLSLSPATGSNAIAQIQETKTNHLGPPLINFIQRQQWADTVHAITRYQAHPPPVVEDVTLLAFITDQLAAPSERAGSREAENAIWMRSQELQRSEVEQADIRRGLEAVGF